MDDRDPTLYEFTVLLTFRGCDPKDDTTDRAIGLIRISGALCAWTMNGMLRPCRPTSAQNQHPSQMSWLEARLGHW